MDHPATVGNVAAARAVARLRAVISVATLAMLVLSGPLWNESEAFPRVPFLAHLPAFSAPVSWVRFAIVLAALSAAAAGLAWRRALAVSLALLTALILEDQHRFQPWAYQFLSVGLLLASLPPALALRYVGVGFAALYLHSGLSKLDVSFCDEMGALFLATAVRPLGMMPSGWPPALRTAAILVMPAWEIAVAAALLVPRTRRVGVAGAIALHLALLLILGPFGLRHSTIVLVWNAAMIVEVVLTFGPDLARGGATIVPGSRRATLVKGVFWAAVVLPFGERAGLLDSWPAHALYASHVERTAVFLFDDGKDEWPESIGRHLDEEGLEPWRRLDLTAWSRAVRGVPVYPQARACRGLAEALAARYGGRRLVRVVAWGRADRLTGRRERLESVGLEAIRRDGNRYRLNAHPAGAFCAPRDASGRPGVL